MWHNSHGNHIPDGKCIHGAKFQLCSSSHHSPSRIGPTRPRHRHCMRKRGLNKSDNGQYGPAGVAYLLIALREIEASAAIEV
ncbi:hypothetical protein QQF64_015311 [Cirrhinus molitorella]|uniref:Uncharacterized protein n=1 Tax=Cirrhinus molitorella TaxID=172907 RepID=A0ABR3NVC7_9TELE